KYFFQKIICIMSETQDLYLSSIINRYVVRYLPYLRVACSDNIGAASSLYMEQLTDKLLETISPQDLFCLYMAFHTYIYMLAHQTADIVIDITKLATDTNYHHQVRSQLISATGLPITFEDMTEIQQYYPFDPALINWNEIRENVDFAVRSLDHAFARAELS